LESRFLGEIVASYMVLARRLKVNRVSKCGAVVEWIKVNLRTSGGSPFETLGECVNSEEVRHM
jgi:hypothetical protein